MGIIGSSLVKIRSFDIARTIPKDLQDNLPKDDIWTAAKYFEIWKERKDINKF